MSIKSIKNKIKKSNEKAGASRGFSEISKDVNVAVVLALLLQEGGRVEGHKEF